MNVKTLLSTSFIALTSLASFAQDAGKAYAITGKKNNNFFWADIKQVDIKTGKVEKVLFEADVTQYKTTYLDGSKATNLQDARPTVFGVAACALDTRHNRLYFAPMHVSDIRYLDLNKPGAEFTVISRNVIPVAANGGYQTEESQLSRMVIGADGYGYAITNDANHLIRFNTGKKNQVEDLGNIVDAEDNKGMSIHNKCTSWGGDIVADAFGKLVMISANHNVFVIDVDTRIATYKGAITGLPGNYSTNGAVVDTDGKLVVSSANVFDALYKVDMKDLKAERMESKEAPFNASDLANGNMLNQKEADEARRNTVGSASIRPLAQANTDNHVFPNPVTTNEFKIQFGDETPGQYNVAITDLSGKAITSKVISVSGKGQAVPVQLAGKLTKGMYMVKVTDIAGKFIFTERIIVQ
jgi:hypothetical protein